MTTTPSIAAKPCPGCQQLLELGETCQICRSMANIRRLNAQRKGVGRFVTMSLPPEPETTRALY